MKVLGALDVGRIDIARETLRALLRTLDGGGTAAEKKP